MAENGLIPVTYARHGNRYWKRFSTYEFARSKQACPVIEKEFLNIAANFPMLFRRADATVEPVALLSLTTCEPTPFVSDDGRWLASYVPSALRCPPFHADFTGEKERDLGLLVDETAGLITDNPLDEAFFTEEGELSLELSEVLRFLGARAASAVETRAMCSVVNGLDLLEPIESCGGVTLPKNCLAVNRQRLDTLTQAEKLALFDVGAFQMVHAHQVSLAHIDWLSRVQEEFEQPKHLDQNTEVSDISRFLAAMAHAQNDEVSMVGGV